MGRMGAAGRRLGAEGLPGPRAGPGASWGRKNLALMGMGRGAVGTKQIMPTVQHLGGRKYILLQPREQILNQFPGKCPAEVRGSSAPRDDALTVRNPGRARAGGRTGGIARGPVPSAWRLSIPTSACSRARPSACCWAASEPGDRSSSLWARGAHLAASPQAVGCCGEAVRGFPIAQTPTGISSPRLPDLQHPELALQPLVLQLHGQQHRVKVLSA